LGGIPSANKTNLVNNITDNVCINNQPVLLFSYDDGKTELRYRTFARFGNYTIEDFNQKRINKEEIKQLCRDSNINNIMKLKYVVEENIPIDKWEDLIGQIQKLHGKPPVIMIDYLRKLRTENSTSDERLRVDNILSNLTGLAKKYNIPVVAISELARDSYKSGQRLGMASFKESGNLEYEASWLGILAAVEEKNGGYKLKDDWEKIIEHDGNVDLIVFKAKRGTGITGKIPLKVDRDKMTVTDRPNAGIVNNVQPASRPSIFGTGRN
jgi:replicative DNA helicase